MNYWLNAIIFLSQQRPKYGKGSYTKPFNSAAGIPENVAIVILIIAVLFFTYVAYKVNQGLKTKASEQQPELQTGKSKKKKRKKKKVKRQA